jgi:hypothetical protein
MRINYKNTALSFLEDPKNFSMHTPDPYAKPTTEKENLRLLHGLMDQFSQPGFADHFSKNIQYITQPFYEAYRRSESKLKEVVMTTEIDDSGTFIMQWPNHTQTIFYNIKTNGKKGDEWDYEVFICMFTKAKINDSFGLDVLVYLGKEEGQIMDFVWKGFVDQGRDMTWWVADLMLFKTFLKYADVETKIIPGNKKDNHIGVKYFNETKRKIEVLDSTYYTTISRTEGFGVRGHFRFQPYGPQMAQRRLQWIPAFEKTGYTKRAKILTHE